MKANQSPAINQPLPNPSQLPQKQFTRQEIVDRGIRHLSEGTLTAFEIGKDLGLTPKQIKFCELYMSLRKDYFGNGIQAAADAYGIEISSPAGRANASRYASHALASDGVKLLCAMLLSQEGLNDEHVDKQLAFLIEQNADLKSKIMAIKEYNNLKGRIKNTTEVIHKHIVDFSAYTVDELETFTKLMEKGMIKDDPQTGIGL